MMHAVMKSLGPLRVKSTVLQLPAMPLQPRRPVKSTSAHNEVSQGGGWGKVLKYFAAPRLAFLRLQLFHQRGDRWRRLTPPCVLPKSGSAPRFTHHSQEPCWVIPPFSTFRIVIFVFEEHEVSGALLASHLNI